MVEASGVAVGGANAAVLLGDQVVDGQRLVARVAPELGAHALVQALGKRLGQAVGQGLEQDGGVVIMVGDELALLLLHAQAGGDGEQAEVVGLGSGASSCGAMFTATRTRLVEIGPLTAGSSPTGSARRAESRRRGDARGSPAEPTQPMRTSGTSGVRACSSCSNSPGAMSITWAWPPTSSKMAKSV